MDTTSGILLRKFSDHQPYFTVLNDFILKEPPFTYTKITKNDNISIQNCIDEIQTSSILSDININIT